MGLVLIAAFLMFFCGFGLPGAILGAFVTCIALSLAK